MPIVRNSPPTSAVSLSTTTTAPTPGDTLTGTDVTFSWDPGTEKIFRFRIGTASRLGDLFDSGETSLTSATAPTLPTDGSTLFVTLSYKVNGVWH